MRFILHLKILAVVLLLQTTFCHAATSQMLAIVEENAGKVSFYEQQSGKSLGRLGLGYLPHEIAITKDGKTAYVSNFGIKDYDSGAGTPGASISAIDVASRSEMYRLYTFNPQRHQSYSQIDSAPHGVKLRPPHEQLLYVNAEKGHKILVFDTQSKSLIKTFTVSANAHNIYFSADGKILWVMAGKDGVIRMDADTGKMTGQLALSTAVRGLKYTPDGRYLMLSAVNQIVWLDPKTLSIVKEFNNLGVGAILYSDVSPNQKYIVAPAAFDNQVLIIDVASAKVIKRIVTGLNPVTVMIEPEGKFAYVTNATDKHVSKINLHTFKTRTIFTNDGPNGIALLPSLAKKSHKRLILGVALPLSGEHAAAGRDMMRGYEYWRINVARAGGLYVGDQAYHVKIVYLDTQSDLAKIASLTQTLLSTYHVNILLSTYGTLGYNIEKQVAQAHKVMITPAQTNTESWLPNDIATGFDYFVTSQAYDQGYYKQYNFKASHHSAVASALGLQLQNSLFTAKNFNYQTVSDLLEHHKFNIFYQY
jgi:DNA-binding beta-propeller fold protein YncE